MDYDVVIVGAGPAGLAGGDPAEAARPRPLRRRAGEGLRGRRPHPLRRRARPLGPRRAAPRLAQARRADPHRGHRGPLLPARPGRPDPHPQLADAEADVEPRQLHRLHGQRLPLAGRPGRGPRRRDLPRHGRERAGLRRRRRGPRRRRRRVRPRQGPRARPELRARHGAPRQIHLPRRRRPRLALQAGHRALRPRRTAASRRSTASA